MLNLRLRNKQEAQEYKYFLYSNKRRRFIDANSRSVGAPRDKGKPSILAKDTSKITIINQFCLYFPTCKRLVPGAIPTLNLPEKSIPSTSTSAPRRELVKHELTPKSQYTSLDDLNRKVERLKLTGCSRTVNENNVTLVFWSGLFALPKLSVTIEATLNFTLADFNWLLPDDHAFYLAHKRSVRHATLSSLLSSLLQFQLCDGLPFEQSFISVAVDLISSDHCFENVIRHTVPVSQEHYDTDRPTFQAKVFLRSHDCHVLCDGDKCKNCDKTEKCLEVTTCHGSIKLVFYGALYVCTSKIQIHPT